MSESKTPLTDEARKIYYWNDVKHEFVTYDFACQLETELAELHSRFDLLDHAYKSIEVAPHELAASRAEARLWERRYDEQTSTAALTAQERDASKAREAKLAEALEAMMRVVGPIGKVTWADDDQIKAAFGMSEKALAEWRAAK